jgi:NAD(P)H-hydrate epimerase
LKIITKSEYESILEVALEKLRMSMDTVYELMAKSVFKHIPDDNRVIYLLIGNSKKGRATIYLSKYLLNSSRKLKVYIDSGLDQKYLSLLDVMKIKYEYINKNLDISSAIVIDGLYYSKIDSTIKTIVEKINISNSYVISLESPTGTNIDNGIIYETAVNATKTITFITPKYSNVLYPAASYCGDLIVEDIGIPEFVYIDKNLNVEMITRKMIKNKLRARTKWSHKGDYGTGLLIAGSTGMSGAAVLSSKGALRSGIGLLKLVIPETLNTIVKSSIPEVITYPMSEIRSGIIRIENINKILDLALDNDVVCFGPGCGVSAEMYEVLKSLINNTKKPLLIDADGLNILCKNLELLNNNNSDIILTPHIGEMSRLTGYTKEEIALDPVNIARKYAVEWKKTIVLKSGRTIVATPDGKAYINITGNPGMATAGSGDVLSGMITSFIAQKYSIIDAILIAVYIHGFSGDLMAAKKSEYSLIAGDLVDGLSTAFQQMEV